MKIKAALAIISALIVAACQSGEVGEAQFISHDLALTINLENQEINFHDKGVISLKWGANLIYLKANSKIESFSLNSEAQDFLLLDSLAVSRLSKKLASKIVALDPPKDAVWMLFDIKSPQKADFSLKYSAVFDDDVSDVKFSNQNVGREITGTVQEQGAYLSPASFYYPRGDDGLMDFRVTATIPPDWESISDGNQIATISTEENKVQAWENPYQSDGLMFMAAPFVVASAKAGDVNVFCYFFVADTNLFETYLPATVEYVNMYAEMIGPYPYKRFTVAENFFPTGYGMPAWTLLGQQVIRLPFIVMTSLGHEVLHNYWGNSVYVDYENGNWCEGLTVYGADYLYKLNRSASSARDYRKDILKQYKSYVNASNEFPVREFRARHNAESRTIGYNKTMMIFHMIEEVIGKEAFFQAWRDMYASKTGQKVSWEQWVEAYEKTSGQDLSFVIPEWVDRKGAAQIKVNLLETEKIKGSTRVKFQVSQSEETPYHLQIPVRFLGDTPRVADVVLSAPSAIYEFTFPGDFTAFELDPDYNLFRHLYPQEVEPTLAAVMGTRDKQFIYFQDELKDTLKRFGDNLTEGDTQPLSASGQVSVGLEGNYALISLNSPNLPSSLQELVQMDERQITIDGRSYPREGHSFVLSADEEEIAAKLLLLITEDPASLPRIGELIPHYGKYSYLVFKGSRNVGKGHWPALESPLRVKIQAQ
jgi:aminopeptidase N